MWIIYGEIYAFNNLKMAAACVRFPSKKQIWDERECLICEGLSPVSLKSSNIVLTGRLVYNFYSDALFMISASVYCKAATVARRQA